MKRLTFAIALMLCWGNDCYEVDSLVIKDGKVEVAGGKRSIVGMQIFTKDDT